MADSEYSRLARVVAKLRAGPRRSVTADPASPEEIAAIKLAQSVGAKNEWTRRVLERFDTLPPAEAREGAD